MMAVVLDPIGNQMVDEGATLSFTATAGDSASPSTTFTWSLDYGPSGATIDSATGEFSWTPTEEHGSNLLYVSIRATSNDNPYDSVWEEIGIDVAEVNNGAPVIYPVDPQYVNEGSNLSFAAWATDVDSPSNFTWSLDDGPAGATIDPGSGLFSWTPGENDGPGTFTVVIRVTDDGLSPQSSTIQVLINVAEVNHGAPIINAIGDKTVYEGDTLTFTATATDSDWPESGFTWSLDSGAPSGATIDAFTGEFTWATTEANGPGTYSATIRVTDDGSPNESYSETISIYVHEVNAAPVILPIGDRAVVEGETISFTASATDPDDPANSLTWSLDTGAPSGATIDAATGVFSWTPTEADGPNSYSITIRVTDDGFPSKSSTETITITVTEVNTAPVIAPIGNQAVIEGDELTFTATATDSDDPANTLTWSLDSGAPSGATINSSTGVFSWSTNETHGPGTYTVTIRVTDDGSPAKSSSETITITVTEANTAPTINSIGNKSVAEGSELNFTVTATDQDLPANSLSWSLDSGAPTGASIDATTGVFTWTPTEDDGPGTFDVTIRVTDNGSPTMSSSETITITVYEANTAPVIDSISDRSVDEGTELTFTVTASDSDMPENTFTWSLGEGAPEGAEIDPESGVFSWTPGESHGGNEYEITVLINDGGAENHTASATFKVTVHEVNTTPSFREIDGLSVDEGDLLEYQLRAYDPDEPSQTLTYSLLSGAPTGLSVSSTGLLAWTPTAEQAGDDYTVSVEVSDGYATDTMTFTITVYDVRHAPVIASTSVNVGSSHTYSFNGVDTIHVTFGASEDPATITIDYTATDDDPGTTFSFDGLDLPTDATITPSGSAGAQFAWTIDKPTTTQVYKFQLRVSDGGTSPLYGTKTVYVHLGDDPAPIARDDEFVVANGVTLERSVIANDKYEDFESPPAPRLINEPSHAAYFQLRADGTFTYIANAGYNGVDSFEYALGNSGQGGNTARANILVQNVSQVPDVYPNYRAAKWIDGSELNLDYETADGKLLSVKVLAPEDPSSPFIFGVDFYGAFTVAGNHAFTFFRQGMYLVEEMRLLAGQSITIQWVVNNNTVDTEKQTEESTDKSGRMHKWVTEPIPTGDLIIFSTSDAKVLKHFRDAYAAIGGQTIVEVNNIAEANKAIRDRYAELGRKISVVIQGHGMVGIQDLGDDEDFVPGKILKEGGNFELATKSFIDACSDNGTGRISQLTLGGCYVAGGITDADTDGKDFTKRLATEGKMIVKAMTGKGRWDSDLDPKGLFWIAYAEKRTPSSNWGSRGWVVTNP